MLRMTGSASPAALRGLRPRHDIRGSVGCMRQSATAATDDPHAASILEAEITATDGVSMSTLLLRLLPLCGLLAGAVHAECVAHSSADRPHLVELYTSEGCSSCPPAERWLSSLRDSSGYAALEFHVDYWDTDSWRDPYADARYTERQKAIVARGRRNLVYTPQVVIDGQLWKDWPKAPPPVTTDTAGPSLSLRVTRGPPLHVTLDTDAADAGKTLRMHVAVTENALSNAVDGGENRGATLSHDHVVRAFSRALPLGHAEVDLELPAALDPIQSSVVAFVQDERGGGVVQVVRLPLAGCTD
jgi:hypothetical protein